MPKAKLKVAIIGTGMIANAGHIPAWKNLRDDVEIVAVSDQNPDRARAESNRGAGGSSPRRIPHRQSRVNGPTVTSNAPLPLFGPVCP